jgi:MoxR-like ATPase
MYDGNDVQAFHEIIRKVPIAEVVVRFAVRIAAASRPHTPAAPDYINELASWGAGLRAGQYLVLGAKARALLNGQAHVSVDDIIAVAHSTLRHRILLNYRAEAQGVTVEEIVDRLIKDIPRP